MSVSYQARLLAGLAVTGAGVLAAVSMAGAEVTAPVSHEQTALLAAATATDPTTIKEVVVATHDDVATSHDSIDASRADVHTTKWEALLNIVAAIRSGDIGSGDIEAILAAAAGDVQADRQSVRDAHGDIHTARTDAAGEIKTIAGDNHDGSTVTDVKAIVDTAKKDNAINRSMIVADVGDSADTRHTAAADDAATRQSVRAGDITAREGAQQIHTTRADAHTAVATDRAQIVSTHQTITTVRRDAASEVHQTVKNAHTGKSK
jgi:hypothetical protein